MTICEKTCEITKSNVPIRDKMFRYNFVPKCDGGQTVWPYYDLDSTGTASCALPVRCALVWWEWLHQVRGQARPLLLTSDNTTGIVTTHIPYQIDTVDYILVLDR